MTTWTSRATPTTSWTGRTPIANEGGLLLINATDYLLINGTDRLIISLATSGTSWTARTIPS